MKAMKSILIGGGALLALAGVAQAQGNAAPARGAEMTRQQAVERADQMFGRFDANNDGQVTQDEARQSVAARSAERQQRRAARQGQAFERLDANRDGQLSREEFEQRRAMRTERREARGQRGAGRRGGGGGMGMGMRGAQAAQLFGSDGVITRDEFRQQAVQRFDATDANRDGTVTRDERRAARQQGRHRAQAANPQN